MYFYHHYLQLGYKLDFLLSLDFWHKQFMVASLDITLAKANDEIESKYKLLKDNVTPVVTF